MSKYKPIGKRYFKIREPIFKLTVHVFLNYRHSEFAAFARRKGATTYKDDPDYDKNFMAFSTEMERTDGPTEWIICLKEFDWAVKHQGTLIHEIVHTVVKMWRLNNIPVTPDNQEFFAHSVGILYEEIAGRILRLKKKG